MIGKTAKEHYGRLNIERLLRSEAIEEQVSAI